VKQAPAGVVDPRVLHTRTDVPATSRRILLGEARDCVTHQHVRAGGRLLPGDQRSALVQQVTAVRTGIPTDAVTEAPVDLVLRGPCHGSARGPRTETAPAPPERSPRGA